MCTYLRVIKQETGSLNVIYNCCVYMYVHMYIGIICQNQNKLSKQDTHKRFC